MAFLPVVLVSPPAVMAFLPAVAKSLPRAKPFLFFFFPSLTTFPAAVMLFEHCNEKFTCGVGVVTLVRM